MNTLHSSSGNSKGQRQCQSHSDWIRLLKKIKRFWFIQRNWTDSEINFRITSTNMLRMPQLGTKYGWVNRSSQFSYQSTYSFSLRPEHPEFLSCPCIFWLLYIGTKWLNSPDVLFSDEPGDLASDSVSTSKWTLGACQSISPSQNPFLKVNLIAEL